MKHLSLTVAFTFLTTGIAGAFEAQNEKVLFEEPFVGDLGKEWSWVRENPKAWRIEKGALVLRSLPGYLHRKSNNSRNILLRPLPKSNKQLAVEVHLESEPKFQFEHAGLVWYADDDNYVWVGQEDPANGKVELTRVAEKAGIPGGNGIKNELKAVWLRLVISGNKITAEYKPTEKEQWQVVGQSDIPVQGAARVGVMSGGTPKEEVERYVRFRHFRILEIENNK